MRALLLVTSALTVIASCTGRAPVEDNPSVAAPACAASERCEDDRGCGGGFCDDGCCRALDPACPLRGICEQSDLCNPFDQAGCGSGELCTYVDGDPTCVGEPEIAAPASCTVAVGERLLDDGTSLPPAVIASGAPLQLSVIARDASGSLTPYPRASWSVTSANASITDDGVFTATCAIPTCTIRVLASVRGTECEGVVRVYAPVAADRSRVVVIDRDTGERLSGVYVSAQLTDGPVATFTDNAGVASFSGLASRVSVFPLDHAWHTIIAPPADVLVATARTRDESTTAGVKGTVDFDHVSTLGDIKLAFAGTAIRHGDFSQLAGEQAKYLVELEGVTDPGGELETLPSPLVLGLGQDDIKGNFVAFGATGPTIAWAIGGKVQLAKVGPIISKVTGSDEVNPGGVLGAVLPFFATFDSALVTNVAPPAASARPPAPAEDMPVPFEQWPFDEIVMQPNTLLSQSANYTMPTLPCAPGRLVSGACDDTGLAAGESPFARGALLMSGVAVAGIGFVPLGITAGLDDFDSEDGDDFDGALDYDPDAPNNAGKGKAILDYAPPHDGLEGSPFVAIAIAGDESASSTLVHVTRALTSDNVFPAGAFLQQAGGVFSSSALTFALDAAPDADFHRLVLDGDEGEWDVWFAGVPDAPLDLVALVPVEIAPQGRASHARIDAGRFGTGDVVRAPASLADLFAFDGADMSELSAQVGAWSSTTCTAVSPACVDVDAP